MTVNQVSTSYTYYLEPTLDELRKCCYSDKLTIEDYRYKVFRIIKPAKVTEAKVRFIHNVLDMNDKKDIYTYICRSVRKAKQYKI